MSGDRAPFIVSAILVAASLIAALWNGEGMTVGVCAVALFVSVFAAVYCAQSASKYAVTASLAVLLCTVLSILLIPNDAFIAGEATDHLWIYASAVILGIALIPQALLFFFVAAAMFKASYNWVMVSGLGWLVGTGMLIPKYLMVLVLQREEAELGMVINAAIVIGMMVNLIMFIVSFFFIGRALMKGRQVITSNGLEEIR
ncbi:MAG: hypothetical protein FWH44_02370 [Methanomassiliicoccaceae archaeon]|nr:hypothetical protein [Methanomassiliicoccaceae archaeon]